MKREKFFLMLTAALASVGMSAQTVNKYPQKTNIPTVYIETSNGKLPADKENYIPCTLHWVEDGKTTNYELTGDGIRGRGNSTWDVHVDKKPYRLKFDSKTELLGKDFAKAKSWTLLANVFDKSMMRNALTYHLGKFMGLEFCPAARFVDLFINGEYRGTYQVSDQVEVRKKRVDIDEDTGWLLEYANDQAKVDDPKIAFINGQTTYGYVQIKNPEFTDDNIWSNPELKAELEDYMNNNFAKKLTVGDIGDGNNYDYMNPRTGYRSMVDAESLVNWYVATEITANWDGFYSVYMFREADAANLKNPTYKNDLLHFSPLWDEDLAYGNNTEPDGLRLNLENSLLAFSNPSPDNEHYRRFTRLVAHMYDDPWFANAVKMRFNELIAGGLESFLTSKIEDMRAELRQSANENYKVWDIYDPENMWNLNKPQGNWDNDVDFLKDFVTNRLKKLKQLFEEKAAGIEYYDENTAFSPKDESNKRVVFNRKAVAGMWNTICLPFDVSQGRIDYVFGEGTDVQEFTGVTSDEDGTVALNFKKVDKISAGTPYLIFPTLDVKVPFSLPWRVTHAGEPKRVTHNGYSFTGTYGPTKLAENELFVGAGNELLRPSANSGKLKGMRAYFSVPTGSQPAPARLCFDGETTAVPAVMADADKDTKVYGVDGRYAGNSVNDLVKGVYIVNGKKLVVK